MGGRRYLSGALDRRSRSALDRSLDSFGSSGNAGEGCRCLMDHSGQLRPIDECYVASPDECLCLISEPT